MGLRILIVDDSATFRAIIRKGLGLAQLDVTAVFEAPNGKAALQVLRQEWVDLVFSDINMPEMGGDELLRQMSQDKVLGSIPVIVVSSDRSSARMDEVKALGARAYVTKPFRPEEFRAVVHRVLGTGGGEPDAG